jgi:hypothetical protein
MMQHPRGYVPGNHFGNKSHIFNINNKRLRRGEASLGVSPKGVSKRMGRQCREPGL